MNEQWQELKETIIEMRDNDGIGTQQEVCKFLANLMDVLEEQQPKTGHWIWQTEDIYKCSECGEDIHVKEVMNKPQYVCCPMCGAKMESEG